MKDISISIAVILGLLFAPKCDALSGNFIGPGVVECNQGECAFSVEAGKGCFDPCHTRTHYHMYDMSFIDVADVIVDQSKDSSIDEQCFFKHAKHIDAHYPDRYVEIEEGCTAKCNGCIFAPTIQIRKWLPLLRWLMHSCVFCWAFKLPKRNTGGPTNIDCRNGRCTSYTTDTFNCGNEIEEASKSFGSFQTLLDGSNTVYSLYGYEGINKNDPITIPQNCILDCSGCSRHVNARKKNLRSINKRRNQH